MDCGASNKSCTPCNKLIKKKFNLTTNKNSEGFCCFFRAANDSHIKNFLVTNMHHSIFKCSTQNSWLQKVFTTSELVTPKRITRNRIWAERE